MSLQCVFWMKRILLRKSSIKAKRSYTTNERRRTLYALRHRQFAAEEVWIVLQISSSPQCTWSFLSRRFCCSKGMDKSGAFISYVMSSVVTSSWGNHQGVGTSSHWYAISTSIRQITVPGQRRFDNRRRSKQVRLGKDTRVLRQSGYFWDIHPEYLEALDLRKPLSPLQRA